MANTIKTNRKSPRKSEIIQLKFALAKIPGEKLILTLHIKG